jgi:hypothetical protein
VKRRLSRLEALERRRQPWTPPPPPASLGAQILKVTVSTLTSSEKAAVRRIIAARLDRGGPFDAPELDRLIEFVTLAHGRLAGAQET